MSCPLLMVSGLARADDLVLDRFGGYLDSLRTQAGIPGLAAVVVSGSDIAWERGFGNQDLARSLPVRPDTPFHLDGLTQTLAASLLLRCVEEGRLSLDDRVGRFWRSVPEPEATIRQLLTHTDASGAFRYRAERLDPLGYVIAACTGESYRSRLAQVFDTLAMINSVPGPDAAQQPPDAVFTPPLLARYRSVLDGLATPYAVDSRKRAWVSQYTVSTLLASAGVVSTARDLAQFVLGLGRGLLLRPETLAQAWRAPLGPDGRTLPHGLGWFVQTYNGETVVWQFGMQANASSSLVVTVPGRGLTLILLANSDGLSRPFPLAGGDVTTSVFAKLFLALFVR